VSAHGDRQHASTEDQGQLPVAVPPIRDAHPLFIDEPEQGLDSFDSEISLGIADRNARVELTSDLDFFPSEQVEAHDHVIFDQPPVLVVDEVVAVDRLAAVAATESVAAAPPEEAVPVAAIPPPPSVPLTRRLALVAGIFACLGLPALGVLLWRLPTPMVAPPAVRDAVFPAARTVPPEPIPALLATARSGGLATFKPTPPREPVGAIEPPAATRGPSETPVPPVPRVPERIAVAPGTAAPVGPERPTRSTAVASEPTGVPLSVAPAATPMATSISNAPSDANVRPSPTATPLTPSPATPSMNVPAAASVTAPSIVAPAMPSSAEPVRDAGETIATTPALARDAADIDVVLTRYRSAFGELDPSAVSQVWPNADSRALARAFRGLEQQGITFDNCDITVAGTSAAASCAGTVRYVTKVGSKDPRTERRRWQFTFGKVRDRWTIQTVESR
jgi:hypothetical protein